MPRETAKLLKFTVSGHTIHLCREGYSCCSCTGYESPESFVKPYHWWADAPDKLSTHYNYEFPADGIPVIDLRQAVNTEAGRRMVISGPMVNVDSDQVVACPEPSPIMAGAMAGNEYGTLLALQKVSRIGQAKYGPLDEVPIATYVQLWREAGARIGRCYVDGDVCRIEWE